LPFVDAGVSAAFGAPVGGVLFSMEEAASFWSPSMTWRTFFAAMIAAFVKNVLVSGLENGRWLTWSSNTLILFETSSKNTYSLVELIPFVAMGALGGILGAVFTWLNLQVTKCRRHWVQGNCRRLMEVVLIAVIWTR
jgi:chloride channel 7